MKNISLRQFTQKILVFGAGLSIFIFLGGKALAQNLILENEEAQWPEKIEEYFQLAQAYNDRGVVYKNNSQLELALKDFDKAVEFSKDYFKTTSKQSSRNSRELENAIDEKISKESIMDEIYNNRGYVYMLKKQYELALKDLTRASEINPQFSKAYYNRANVYAQISNFDAAIKDYNSLLSIDRTDYRGYSNRAFVYMNLKKYQLAILDLNKAIKINPQYSTAYFNRSLCYQYIGKIKEALDNANQAKKLGAAVDETYLQALEKRVPDINL